MIYLMAIIPLAMFLIGFKQLKNEKPVKSKKIKQIRKFKDISDYYAIEKDIKFPAKNNY